MAMAWRFPAGFIHLQLISMNKLGHIYQVQCPWVFCFYFRAIDFGRLMVEF